MKKYYILLIALGLNVFISFNSTAQSIGIGATSFTPDASSMLEIQATGRGVLIPRMLWAVRPGGLGLGQDGLLVYFTDGDGVNGKGFYYWNGTMWVKLFGGTNNDHVWNQNAVLQTANFRISGTGQAGQTNVATIGNHPTYGTSYAAFWRNGSDYSLLTDANNTFLNAPTTAGNIYFRAQNTDRAFINGTNGNMGIGNIAPTQRLEVTGSELVTGNIYVVSTGNGIVHHTSLGLGGQALNWKPTPYSTYGIWLENAYSEGGGFYADGDVAAIWCAGDLDLLRIYDEDALNTADPNAGIRAKYDGAGNSHAPIFYDINNTTYYMDPNNDTRLNDIGWGNAFTRTQTRDDAGAMGGRSGFYETSVPAPAADWPVGANSWWHLLDIRHSNTGNNYAMQFAGSFFDQNLWFRKTNNLANQPWVRILTTADNGNYILNQNTSAQAANFWISGNGMAGNAGDRVWMGYTTAWGGGTHIGLSDDHGHMMLNSFVHLPFQAGSGLSGLRMAGDAAVTHYGDLVYAGQTMSIRQDGTARQNFYMAGGSYADFSPSSEWSQLYVGRHIDAKYYEAYWGGATLFLGWGSDKVILGPGSGGGDGLGGPTALFGASNVAVKGTMGVSNNLLVYGNTGLGTTAPAYRLHAVADADNIPVIFAQNTNTSAGTMSYGVRGEVNAVGLGSAGVYGYCNNSGQNEIGVLGDYSLWGASLFGLAWAASYSDMPSSRDFGVFGTVNFSTGTGVYGKNAQFGGSAYGVYSDGNFAATGFKSASVPTSKGNQLLYSMESPEIWFEDIGSGQLINGQAHIELDPMFLETVVIDAQHPMVVFLQEMGESKGLYVKRGMTGFDVIEKDGGQSSVEFSYRILAKRVNYQDHRFGVDGNQPLEDNRDKYKYIVPFSTDPAVVKEQIEKAKREKEAAAKAKK
jgi:hypothetical protein